MSRDRGTAVQAQDQGYGLVTDLDGSLIPDLVMTAASQEHGTLTTRDGARLPNLPNHACATAAQHYGYHVIDSTRTTNTAPQIQDIWQRVTGW
jgi:D-serine deaminase-like pyridoxal phosphate-dependent protein